MSDEVVKIREELLEQLINESGQTTDFDESASLLTWGINSITVMRVLSQWAKKGYKVPFSELIRNPYIDSWAELFAKSSSVQNKKMENQKKAETNMYEPFPLTDVQYAYWIGRDSNQNLGGVGCHGYFEVDCESLDLKRLEQAWHILFEYHPMLRACFIENGTQKVLKEPYHKKVQMLDLSTMTETERQEELEKLRAQHSHRLLHIDQGEVISLLVTQWGKKHYRMHFEIDLLVCDVQSFGIILQDFAAYYLREELPKVEKEWDFSNYLYNKKAQKKDEVERAKDYWSKRVIALPDGPKLPVKNKQSTSEQLKFHRHAAAISPDETKILVQRAGEQGLTLAVVLLTAYGKTISKWADNKRFLMNMPMFDRDEEDGIQNVVADFTNLLLVEMDFSKEHSFTDSLQQVQQSFLESMDHSAYSGVEILRELRKQHGEDVDATTVFSCNLGTTLVSEDFRNAFGEIDYMISQTPQVLIDFQAFTQDEGLLFIWDAADDMFPQGMIDEMFECFLELIHLLARDKTDWSKVKDILSKSQKHYQKMAEEFIPQQDVPRNMIEDIFCVADIKPDSIALIEPNGENTTFGRLAEQAKAVAGALQKHGVTKGDYVAVIMPRGTACIIAEIAVIAAGAAYVPISIEQPENRRTTILKTAGCKAVLYAQTHDLQGIPENVLQLSYEKCISLQEKYCKVELAHTDSAYVIFTSGSTGNPKGVEITHGAAMNTIDNVNERYQVTEKDCGIAVSSNDFDLSVYDIFGILAKGGRLVLIESEQRRDAAIWLSLIRKYEVTIWNSVPILMKMLLIEAENEQMKIPSLRLVILSGDWIGIELPEKLKEQAPEAHLAAMGGATEASIWSNVFDVELPIPQEWDSIPYGKPLKNQYFRVVGEDGHDCPDEVSGELWIGGLGVAKGYIGEPALTEEKFVDAMGKRWYRTGDNGKFWSNGIIEFLGRKDNQVKIRGHRIELGEIESALCSCEGVEQAVAVVHETGGNRQLNAFVTGQAFVNGEVLEKAPYSETFIEKIKSTSSYDLHMEASLERALSDATERTRKRLLDRLMKEQIEPVNERYCTLVKKWNLQQAEEETARNITIEKDETLYSLLETFTEPFIRMAPAILSGKCNPNELLLDAGFISPNVLAAKMPRGRFLQENVERIIRSGSEAKEQKLRVLEIGARTPQITRRLLQSAGNCSYTIIDKAMFFIRAAKATLNGENVEYIVADLNEGFPQEKEDSEYDVIFLNYTLHQFGDMVAVLSCLKEHLAQNGILMFCEMVKEMPLQDMTSAFLMEEGYSDVRQNTGHALLSEQEWNQLLSSMNLVDENILQESESLRKNMSQHLFIIGNKTEHKKRIAFDEMELRRVLSQKIPEYMVPVRIKALDRFPLTANGKVDRRSILTANAAWMEESINNEREEPVSETEKHLSEVWKEVLGCEVGRNDSYFRLGGDSLLATVLVGKIKENFHVAFGLENIFKYPILSEMAVCIDEMHTEEVMEVEREMAMELIQDKEHSFEPFPLTDVQQAYWIGRNEEFNYSNVSTHCYFEMDCDNFDLQRAEEVWNKLIRTHAMLRAVILKNGEQQRVLKEVDYYKIQIYDCSIADGTTLLEKLRAEMSQETIDIYQWPLFDIRAAKIGDNKSRLFISFDNIVLDGWSMFYLFREWADCCSYPDKEPSVEQVSFRDYVLSCEALKQKEMYQEDMTYWSEKLSSIYPAPEFSIFGGKAENAKRFVRFSHRLSADKWKQIENRLKDLSLTPAVFLMGTYAETIGLWCASPRFSINLTRFNRLKFSDTIDRTVGDYTSLTIHSIDLTAGDSFEKRLGKIQENLWEDLNHPLVSGIEVERMLNKEYGTGSMPVVFTCGLGLEKGDNENSGKYPGKITYGNSQTPQVWLDYQVYEEEGELIISWDALIDVFPPKMLDEMFAAYISLLERLAEKPDIWSKKEVSLVQVQPDVLRTELNRTEKQFPKETLISLFEKSVLTFGERVAVYSNKKQLTYKELYSKAEKLATDMEQSEIKAGDIVALHIAKSWEQMVAVLAVLLAGGIYLPLNIQAPWKRNRMIIEKSGATMLLTENITEVSAEEDPDRIAVYKKVIVADVKKLLEKEKDFIPMKRNRKPSDLAYIIYTSGTTGEPKGVAIEHGGAVNTILDINQRLHITEQDRSIAISDLSFDLSVYDIFGMLAAGGSIVIPEQNSVTEPREWKKLIEQNQVTVWNTVPMFMQMLLGYLQYHPLTKENSLRHIMMSGDWIPLTIRDEIREHIGSCNVFGLGGATEASIWSNIYLIKEVDAAWRSIPYGKPLANQRYYVLNEQMQECPYDVIGDLYIAGEGLAREYWNNSEETDKSFVILPMTGERLYQTGDKALYMRDGNIEFCGRIDDQVKLGGFRVELGEINHAICENAKVKQVESVVKDGEIFSFVVLNISEENAELPQQLKMELEEKLPHYMVPTSIHILEAIPLTKNGKVDRKALAYKIVKQQEQGEKVVEDRQSWTTMEQEVATLWEQVLHLESFGKEDEFVRVGGNSLAAVQLVNQITRKYKIEFMLRDFYRNSTVQKLAAYLEEIMEEEETGLL